MKTELDSAWESAIHNAERARKAEAEIERLQAELAEAKKFKDGMLDVLGGACPKDHKATPFDDFKGCTPCLRAELAEYKQDAERYRWLRSNWDRIATSRIYEDGTYYVYSIDMLPFRTPMDLTSLDAAIDAARNGEGET